MKSFAEFLSENIQFTKSKKSGYNIRASVAYVDPTTKERKVEDIYFKTKKDAEGFKDDVKGFPKGAEVEAIKEL